MLLSGKASVHLPLSLVQGGSSTTFVLRSGALPDTQNSLLPVMLQCPPPSILFWIIVWSLFYLGCWWRSQAGATVGTGLTKKGLVWFAFIDLTKTDLALGENVELPTCRDWKDRSFFLMTEFYRNNSFVLYPALISSWHSKGRPWRIFPGVFVWMNFFCFIYFLVK